MKKRIWLAFAAIVLAQPIWAGEIDDAVAVLKSVKGEGKDNEKAAASWRELVGAGVKALPSVLAGFDGADAIAVNWLRTAVEAIADNEQRAGRKLPVDQLEAFVLDAKRGPRGREIALDLAIQTDSASRGRLAPSLLDDAAAGVRREAVAYALENLQKKYPKMTEPGAADALKELLAKAREVDQVEKIAKHIKTAGDSIDLVKHYGIVTRWQVAGPFDNTKLKGFAAPMPDKVEWKDFATGFDRGVVDLYAAFGKPKGLNKETKKKEAVYALARTEVESTNERPIEIRAQSANAIRIFLNGKEVFARDAYHHGERMDQHIGRGTLKAGKNEIRVKVCQDDRPMEWTFDWQFQLRISDDIGGAVPVTITTAPNAVPLKPEPKKEPKK